MHVFSVSGCPAYIQYTVYVYVFRYVHSIIAFVNCTSSNGCLVLSKALKSAVFPAHPTGVGTEISVPSLIGNIEAL